MQVDIFWDDLIKPRRPFEITKTTTQKTRMWVVTLGKLSVSFEILKPERKSNHGKPTESRGRTKPDV
jgi:hypothetical protein